MKRALVLVALALVAALAGCADLLGFKPLELEDAGPPDVGAPEAGCQHATWPGQPSTGTVGDAGSYTLAIRHVHFTENPDGGVGTFGYDLDGKCTVDQASSSCKSNALVADPTGGVDNSSIQLLNGLMSQQPTVKSSLGDPAVNVAIDEGGFTLLVRLFGLQSAVNQSLVQGLTMAVQTSPGIRSGVPSWGGTDVWKVSASDVVGGLDGGTNSPIKTFKAYVTSGVLVATDPGPITLVITLPGGNTVSGAMPITLHQVVLTGTLVPRADGQFDLANGTIAGRWATSDMLAAIGSLSVSGSALCEVLGGGIYSVVLSNVCPQRDITSTGTDDGTASCDAVSVAMAFDAVAADVANTPSPSPVSTTPCTDAGQCPPN